MNSRACCAAVWRLAKENDEECLLPVFNGEPDPIAELLPLSGNREGSTTYDFLRVPASRRKVLLAIAAAGVASDSGARAGMFFPPNVPASPIRPNLGTSSNRVTVQEESKAKVSQPLVQEQPAPGETLRLVRPGSSVSNFNPAAFAQDRQIPLSYLEPLVQADPQTLRPSPWLARGWAWRDDGLELVLRIRDDVVWHDGTPLTAEDARFSFDVYRSDLDSAVHGFFQLVEAIEATSNTELRVRFLARDPNWLFNAATLPIFSRRQYEGMWDEAPDSERTLSTFDWSTSLPIGTGPWQITEWDESSVDFDRFKPTRHEESSFERLSIMVQEGSRQRLEAWESGQSDIAWPVHRRDRSAIGADDSSIHAVDAASVMFAAFNFANPLQPAGSLWSDPRVRRAASMAINRERYAEEVFDGLIRWDAAGTVSQPWANDAELKSEAFNPEAAEILLSEAGWIDYNGDGVREDINGWPFSAVVIVRDDSGAELISVLARVARDFAAVGLGLSIEALAPDVFAERWIDERTFDLIAYSYDQLAGFTDFDLYGSAWDIRTNPAGWNPGGYSNPSADAAIEEFLGAVSIARQSAAIKRLQRAVVDDLFGLWFGFPRDVVLVAEGIEGFTPDMSWQTARTWALRQGAPRR